MNKIVRDHYPTSKLPADLREGLDPKTHVRIIIEQEMAEGDRAEYLKDLLKLGRQTVPIDDNPVSRIRKLRDEWED